MIKGKNLDKELMTVSNRTAFDLSGAAAQEMVLYNKNASITINKVWVIYEEATSSDTGVALQIGKTGALTAYWTATSEVSKSAAYSKEYTTGFTTIPKDTPVLVSSAGSKAGTGTAYIVIAYTVN